MYISLPVLLSVLAINVNAKVSKINIDSVAVQSKAGRKLLSKARRLDEQEVDYSWLPGYTFQFQKCYSWESYGREENENKEKSIVFRACPQGDCSSNCKYGADYIVQLRDYVEAYTQAKQNLREYNCEMVQENCECDDDQVDDEACASNCYAEAGLNYCEDEEEEFDLGDYADCKELEMENNNGDRRLEDEENALYGGLYCGADGSAVYLGVFTDEQCSTHDNSNAYYKATGQSLPYSSKSIIGSGCVSCENPYYANGDDDNQENQVNEMCMELYEQAGKCETNLNIDYPDTDACTYINNVVPNLEKLYNGEKSSGGAATGWAWFFGLSTLSLAGFIGYQSMNGKKASIDLAEQGQGGVMT